jgi:hypothetical protein
MWELIEVKSPPEEQPHLQVPQIFPDETRSWIQEAVNGRLIGGVFNLDEVGSSEWEDHKSKNVLVPVTSAGQTVHHGISRNLKHITIITCVSTRSGCLVPSMIRSQALEPIRLRLAELYPVALL